jgi:hypothetical protein
MAKLSADAGTVNSAVSTLKSLRTTLALQVDSLNEVEGYLENGWKSEDISALLECVEHTKRKLTTTNKYIGNAVTGLKTSSLTIQATAKLTF